MARLDALDRAIFQFEDGEEWAESLVNGEWAAGTLNHTEMLFEDLSFMATFPMRLGTRRVPWKGHTRPAIDAFLDILSAAPQEMTDRYEALRSLARRFGSGANDWLNRKETSVASFEHRLSDPREPGPVRAAIYDRLMRDDSLVVFTMADDFIIRMFDAADRLKAQVVVPMCLDPEAGLVVAGLNDFRSSSELIMDYHSQIPWALPFALSYVHESSAPYARLGRDLEGYSAFKYLEPHARAVNVQREYVNVDLDREPRPADQPLLYSYPMSLSRRGLHDGEKEAFMRVETRVATGMNEGDVLGAISEVARAHHDSTRIFIEGPTGRVRLGTMDRNLIGSPFGFQPGVVDLVATGPGARVALTNAFTTLSGIRPLM